MPNGEKENHKPEKKKKASSDNGPKKVKVSSKLSLVQDALKLMEESGLGELSFEEKGVKIHLRKGAGMTFVPAPVQAGPVSVSTPAATAASVPVDAATPAAKSDQTTLTAPMVGTFYRASSPDAKPFAEEGAQIEVGQVYCIIEAMKLMNEVKSEVSGRVVKILVQNGQAVEFGQPLLVVDTGK